MTATVKCPWCGAMREVPLLVFEGGMLCCLYGCRKWFRIRMTYSTERVEGE